MMSISPLFLWLLLLASLNRMQEAALIANDRDQASSRAAEVQRGSKTAKDGFQNEDEIRDKFNQWKTDTDAQAWLNAMNYELPEIVNVVASKPHGEKSDVEVRVQTKTGERIEGISIKLVSNPSGFNQIDKRWLGTYVKKWNMPHDVHETLKKFVGEVPPIAPNLNSERMFLDELDDATQKSVIEFFTAHKAEIVSDLFAGDGPHAATWLMVTMKEKQEATSPAMPLQSERTHGQKETLLQTRWIIRSTDDAIRFYSEGKICITPTGSLRIGCITMQRKGGDHGRKSANMLQFKINPAKLFEI